MGRSAKQRKKPVQRRASIFKGSAAALGGMISDNPVMVGGSTAFLVTFFFVSANALWYQPFPHAGAFFATRTIQGFSPPQVDEPETTINIERPSTPVVPPIGDPVVKQVQGILKDLNFYAGTVDGTGIEIQVSQYALDLLDHRIADGRRGRRWRPFDIDRRFRFVDLRRREALDASGGKERPCVGKGLIPQGIRRYEEERDQKGGRAADQNRIV
jgi:hypothetical protein